MKNNLKKNFVWNLIGSTFNSFTSLFFLIIVTRINGIDTAGVFTFAFSNACLLQVFGIYVTRSFQVTENKKEISDSDYLYTKLLTVILMILIGIGFSIVRNYDAIKTTIILQLVLYKALDAFSESIYAIMQRKDQLYNAGISLFIKGVFGVIIFLVADLFAKNIITSLNILIISNVLVIILYDFNIIKKLKFKMEKMNFDKCKKIIKMGFWTFAFTLLTQYLVNAPKYAIDSLLTDDKQTIYGIIAMPASLMVLIASFIIHPFLVEISGLIKNKDYKKLNTLLIKMIFVIIIFTILGMILCYLIGIPMLKILYGVNLEKYILELLIIVLGSGVFAITTFISNIMIAMRKTMSQTIIFFITSIFTFIICNILIKDYSLLGATLSYSITMTVLLILYLIIYIYSIRKEIKNE